MSQNILTVKHIFYQVKWPFGPNLIPGSLIWLPFICILNPLSLLLTMELYVYLEDLFDKNYIFLILGMQNL